MTETGLLMEAATVRERLPPQIPKTFTHPRARPSRNSGDVFWIKRNEDAGVGAMGVSRSKRRTAPGQLEQVPRPKATFPATGLRDAGAFALLFCTPLAAYLPVLRGGLLWGDLPGEPPKIIPDQLVDGRIARLRIRPSLRDKSLLGG